MHEEAFLLRFADEFGDVVLAGEVEVARGRLVHVPEDIGFNGVKAHGLCLAQSVTPVGTRHTRVVHFAGDDLEGSSVELEMFSVGAKGMRWSSCCLSEKARC